MRLTNGISTPTAVLVGAVIIGLAILLRTPGSPSADNGELINDFRVYAAEQTQILTPPANLENEPTPENVREVTEDDYIRGPIDAPITIVEYSDFDCPFCTRFHDTMKELLDERDDVRWVYRHFPLEQLHPQARLVSVASECAAEQEGSDGFWRFTDAYYQYKSVGGIAEVLEVVAERANLNLDELLKCTLADTYAEEVQDDYSNAVASGGQGTPYSVVIGPNGVTSISGAYPITNPTDPEISITSIIETVE